MNNSPPPPPRKKGVSFAEPPPDTGAKPRKSVGFAEERAASPLPPRERAEPPRSSAPPRQRPSSGESGNPPGPPSPPPRWPGEHRPSAPPRQRPSPRESVPAENENRRERIASLPAAPLRSGMRKQSAFGPEPTPDQMSQPAAVQYTEEGEIADIARLRGRSQRVVKNLHAQVASLPIPPHHVGVWRFHNAPDNYQSHRFQSEGTVSDEDLKGMSGDQRSLGQHMYKSSRRENSAAVSFVTSLPQLIDETYHVGGDSQLKRSIHGGGPKPPARRLAYVAVPEERLARPQDVPVPTRSSSGRRLDTAVRGGMSEARDRALRETEVLYLPPLGSGGKAPPPLAVFPNPFPTMDATVTAARPQPPGYVRSDPIPIPPRRRAASTPLPPLTSAPRDKSRQ